MPSRPPPPTMVHWPEPIQRRRQALNTLLRSNQVAGDVSTRARLIFESRKAIWGAALSEESARRRLVSQLGISRTHITVITEKIDEAPARTSLRALLTTSYPIQLFAPVIAGTLTVEDLLQQALAENPDVSPKDVVFISGNEDDLRTAAALRMYCVHFDIEKDSDLNATPVRVKTFEALLELCMEHLEHDEH